MSDTTPAKVTLSEARLAIQSGDNERVVTLYKALVEQSSDEQIIDEATSVLAAMGRADEAAALLETALGRLADSPLLLQRLVKILHDGGQAAACIEALRRLAAAGPPDVNVLVLWGDTAVDEERYKEAVEPYRQAYALSPSPAMLHRLSWAFLRAGMTDDALSLLVSAVRPSREYVECYILIAEVLTKKKQFMNALTAITNAVSLDGNHVAANCVRGEILLLMNQPALAATAFSHALENSPDNISGLLGLSVAEMRQDKITTAIALAQRILVLDPGNVLARERVKKWAQRLPAAADVSFQ